MVLKIEAVNPLQEFIPLKDYVELGKTHSQCETNFMRFPSTFKIVENLLKQAETRSLNMLSIPCSIGFEPLSLISTAMMAGFKLADLTVAAVDYNREILTFARKGQYWAGTPDRHRIDLSFPSLSGWSNSIHINAIKRSMDMVMDYSMPTSDETQAIPISVKPAVLSRMLFVEGDVRTFFISPQPNAYNLALIANVNGTLLEDRNHKEIREWVKRSITPGGLLIVEESIIQASNIDGFEKLTKTKPLEDVFRIQIFKKLL